MAKKLSPMDQKASLKALGDFRSEASKLMKDKMNGLKKVSVMSDSKSGLKEGLQKAEDLLKGSDKYSSEQSNSNFEDRHDHPLENEDDSEEYGEEMDDQMEDDQELQHMTEQELDAKIQELMAMKSKMKK